MTAVPPAPTRCRSRSSTTTPTSTSPATATDARRPWPRPSPRPRAVGVDRLVQIGCDLPGARFTVRGGRRAPGAARRRGPAPQRGAAAGRSAAGSTRRTREIEALAAHPRVRVDRRDRARLLPHRARRRCGAAGVVPLAHRPGQAHRQGPADPRPRRPRRRAAHPRGGGRARAHGAALLLRRRRRWPASACERGYYLSFAGTVTFKNAQGLRDAARGRAAGPGARSRPTRRTSRPAPHRGATNAPYLVPLTVRAMAGVLGVRRPDACARRSSDNSERLYGPW